MGSWFSNPGTGANVETGGGGVGKYLKPRTIEAEPATVDASIPAAGTAKKRKAALIGNFKDFSAW